MFVVRYPFRDFECFEAIIDNELPKKGIADKFGLPLMTYDDFKRRYPKTDCIICVSLYDPEQANKVRQTIRSDGYACFIHRECVETKTRQYFDFFHENGLFVPDEVFVHAGAADGYNEECFVNWTGGKYSKIIAFEPHPVQFKECEEACRDYHNCSVVQAGCSDKTGTLNLITTDGPQGSKTVLDGGTPIKVYALDDYCKDVKVTLIAMDVEGFELNVLKGAAGVISALKPKLAVSVYHKPEDIYEIPLFIKALNPDYKLAIRLYGNNWMDDGICYAY
jgi:FkbM family methyltransferase